MILEKKDTESFLFTFPLFPPANRKTTKATTTKYKKAPEGYAGAFCMSKNTSGEIKEGKQIIKQIIKWKGETTINE